MNESPSESRFSSPSKTQEFQSFTSPDIPIEIISDEEMALIESAFAATRSSLFSICSASQSALSLCQSQASAKSIQSITLLSKRRLNGCSVPDVEDSANLSSPQKKNKVAQSLFRRFRRKTGLYVTDLTASEWCEKQMEFSLLFGKRRISEAMKVGQVRHMKLEEEVVKRVAVHVKSAEDIWAIKLINFISGVNQLLFEGMTRELPIIGFVEGVWMVGIIDEIRMPQEETNHNPILVDTKTRVGESLPAEPQGRNGRLQLMCYKRLWDTLVGSSFPSIDFFEFFSLNPHNNLSEEVRERTADMGVPAMTLDEVVAYYRNTCTMLPPHEQLLLRYELQKDQSVLGEDQFAYDSSWLQKKIQRCLQFWLGEREASYTPEEERWKCRHCQFAGNCLEAPIPMVHQVQSLAAIPTRKGHFHHFF